MESRIVTVTAQYYDAKSRDIRLQSITAFYREFCMLSRMRSSAIITAFITVWNPLATTNLSGMKPTGSIIW